MTMSGTVAAVADGLSQIFSSPSSRRQDKLRRAVNRSSSRHVVSLALGSEAAAGGSNDEDQHYRVEPGATVALREGS